MTLKLDGYPREIVLTIHLELTGIAEEIINNYNGIDIENVELIKAKNKKKGWKNISFDYINKS